MKEIENDLLGSGIQVPNLFGRRVSISLNYFRKAPKRELELVTATGVIYADLLNPKVWNEKDEILFHQPPPFNLTHPP